METGTTVDKNIGTAPFDDAVMAKLKSAGLAETLKRSGIVYSNPSFTPMGMQEPAAQRVPKEKTITSDDILGLVDSIKSRFPNLPPSQLDAISAKLMSSVGASRNNLSDLASEAMNDARQANDEIIQEITETPQQAVARLWNDVKKDEKDVADLMREAHDRKDIDDKHYKEWEKRREEVLAMSDNDPHKAELMRQLELEAQNDLNHAADQEDGRGDHGRGGRLRGGANQAGTNVKKIDEILDKAHKYNVGLVAKDEEEAAKTTNKGVRLSEDASPSATVATSKEKPAMETANNVKLAVKPSAALVALTDDAAPLTAFNAPQPPQGLEVVHNVTIDDVQSPSGGKDRAPGRTIEKK